MTNQGTKGTKFVSDTGKIVDYNNDQFFKFKRAKIPIDQLDQIIKYIDKLDLKWEDSVFGVDNTLDKYYRLSQHAWVGDESVRQYVMMQFESANVDPDWRFDLNQIEDIQYTKYDATPEDEDGVLGGHYDWHSDELMIPDRRICRKLSMTVMLSNSDEYEGGEFQFQCLRRGNIEYQTLTFEKGDVLVFPSIMNHCINPVLKGTRKVLVAWAWGPLFK